MSQKTPARIIKKAVGVNVKKSINITRRAPPKCVVCGTADTAFIISYRDPANPGVGPMSKKAPQNIVWPTASLISCAKCLETTVYKLMNDQGLLNNQKEGEEEVSQQS